MQRVHTGDIRQFFFIWSLFCPSNPDAKERSDVPKNLGDAISKRPRLDNRVALSLHAEAANCASRHDAFAAFALNDCMHM
eukprot:2422553-Amphidinium_carterae.2